MMLVDEQARRTLDQRLTEVLGGEEARTLMAMISDDRLAGLATRADMDAGFAAVDARFADIDARFADIDARFAAVDARFADIDARFADIDARFVTIDARFAAVDARFDQLDQRIDHLEVRMDERFTAQAALLDEKLEKAEQQRRASEERIIGAFRKELNDAIIRQGRNTSFALAGTVIAMAGLIVGVG